MKFPWLNRERLTLHVEPDMLRGLVTKNKKILRWKTRPLPPGTIQNDCIIQAALFAQSLEQLLNDLDIRTRKAALSFNHSQAIQRLLELPPVPQKMLAEAVERKARQEFPLPPEELYLSWQELPSSNASHRQIFAVGIPRPAVDSYVASLRQANIKLTTLDLKPLVLIRAIRRPDIFILDLEPARNSAILVHDFMPCVIRPLNIPRKEHASTSEQAVYLMGEIQRILDFYRATAQVPWSPQICLTGAQSERPKIREVLAGRWPLVAPAPPLTIPENFPLSTYLPNIGLLLKNK